MKTIDLGWRKMALIGVVIVGVPIGFAAHRRGLGDTQNVCPADTSTWMGWASPGLGMMPPESPTCGLIPPPPYLQGLELTDAQQDELLELMLSNALLERTTLREAARSMEQLIRLGASDHFDVERAELLAKTHAGAVSQVLLMHAALDAKVRTLLTPEQRKRIATTGDPQCRQ